MPQLGETVTEGTIIKWLKQVGDAVAFDDSLFEVSTDKVDTEVPSAHVGVLRQILVAEGETVPVGALLAVITDSADDELPDVEAPASAPAPARARRWRRRPSCRSPSGPSRSPARVPASSSNGTDHGFLSPAVRALLDEHGLVSGRRRGLGP